MKRSFLSILLLSCVSLATSAQNIKDGYPITQVPFTSVKVSQNTFWGQRLEASRNVTIPLAFSKCEETNRYENFSRAAQHIKDPSKVFQIDQHAYTFDDTDP